VRAYIEWIELSFAQCHLTINPSKSAAIIITKRCKRLYLQPIVIHGTPVSWRTNINYLDLIIGNRLSWCNHIEHFTKKAKPEIKLVYPLIFQKSRLFKGNRFQSNLITIRHKMTYASVSWSYCPPAIIQPLQFLQNSMLRTSLGEQWFVPNLILHRDLNIEALP
jgi:hypothetical protein